jgi:hypothetical protein
MKDLMKNIKLIRKYEVTNENQKSSKRKKPGNNYKYLKLSENFNSKHSNLKHTFLINVV